MGINDFGGANDPLANPPLGGPSGWAASVRDALVALQGMTLHGLPDVEDTTATAPVGSLLGVIGVPGQWGYVPRSVRSSRPNSTDRLVEAWTGSEWVPIHYDSGWRDVAGLLTADATAMVQTWDAVRLRRVGDTVHHIIRGTVGTGTAAGTTSGINVLDVPWPAADFNSWAMGNYGYGTGPFAINFGGSEGTLAFSPPTAPWGALPFYASGSYPTSAPIPSSLPGTMITTAP